MWLPDDCFMWTETCLSSFYNFNYFNNLRILQSVCVSWQIKCLILLMHGANMKSMKFRPTSRHSTLWNLTEYIHFYVPLCCSGFISEDAVFEFRKEYPPHWTRFNVTITVYCDERPVICQPWKITTLPFLVKQRNW